MARGEDIQVEPGETCYWFDIRVSNKDSEDRDSQSELCEDPAIKLVRIHTPEVQVYVPLCEKHDKLHNFRASRRRKSTPRRKNTK